jgi:hypothetical protein
MQMTINVEWGKCPICGGDLDKEGTDTQDLEKIIWWACYGCDTNIDYLAADDQREWEEYAPHEITLRMEPFSS